MEDETMKTCKRGMAVLLVLVLMLSVISPVSASAFPSKNDGVRHEVCDALSDQAEAYYTDAYSWDSLQSQSGISTESSLAAMQGQLYQSLQDLMSSTMTHSVSYKSLTSYWPYTDTQPGHHDATLFYSDCDGSGNHYNREHVWPKSRASFCKSGGGSDLHHLRPTDAEINSTRSNYTMGDVREKFPNCKTKDYKGKTVLWYNPSADLVEVADNVKGDVARIMLYVYTRWGEPNLCENISGSDLPQNGPDEGGNNGLKVMENLDTVLRWCEEDPVDEWEMTRNDRVQDVQGNRNVFIDYPELAWMLFDREIPSDMHTPSGFAENSGAPAHAITAESSNPAWGTVEVNGRRIQCHPAEGYCVSDVEVSPAGAAEVTRNGNMIHLSEVKEDVTVLVTFAPRTAAEIFYVIPQGTAVDGGTTDCYIGDEIELPKVSGSVTVGGEELRFAGWVDTSVTDTTDLNGTEIHKAGDTYTVEAAQNTLYALYTYQKSVGHGDANTFTRVTEEPENWTGEYVMTGFSDSQEYVLRTNGQGIGDAEASVAIQNTGMEKAGDTLNHVTSDYVIQVAQRADGTYTMKLKGAEEDTYLSYHESGNKLFTSHSESEESTGWNLSFRSGRPQIVSAAAPGRVLQFNAGAVMFRCYTGTQKDVTLYAAGGTSETHYLTPAGECQHAFGPWKVIEEPGYSHEGLERRTCSLCGKTEERVIPRRDLPFTDVPADRFYHEFVCWAMDNEVASGISSVEFAPESTCTRKQVVTFLWKAAGRPEPVNTEIRFPDVRSDCYYAKAVQWAVENGITAGRGNGRFMPNATCTRSEVVTFLWRAAHRPAHTIENPFRDVQSGRFYSDAALWAFENGITAGRHQGEFDPDGLCSRGEVVTFLGRANGADAD